MSEVTNEWLEDMANEFDAEVSSCANYEWDRISQLANLAVSLRELKQLREELATRRAADEDAMKRTRADFLFPADPGSAEEAAFEFANASTEEYRREWWETLQQRLSAADEGAVTVEGWMYEEGDTGHVFTVADMTGMNGWSAASVTIRRKP